MRLADRISQARSPFVVVCNSTGERTRLAGVRECAGDIAACPTRYVLSDELTRLCAALAYSRGARTLSYSDLINIPAQKLWVEWAYGPWQDELDRYGFPQVAEPFGRSGRRGASLCASSDGRRGSIRTFWGTGNEERDLYASPMIAQFDFDSEANESDSAPAEDLTAIRVVNGALDRDSALSNCFSFKFEDSWAEYYDRAQLSPDARRAIERHSLGTIALDIPVLLSFFLLLNTRNGLPQSGAQLERLNRARCRRGKAPLLDCVEVSAPLPCGDVFSASDSASSDRRRPRLHHVRGHIVRRRDEVFWRMPHLRGHASAGVLKTRTVTWSFDRKQAPR
jgi:hypothetical protein